MMTYSADLMCCCALLMEEVTISINALPEDQQDSAWAVVNDNTSVAGNIDDQHAHLYFGILIGHGSSEHGPTPIGAINMAVVVSHLKEGVAHWRNETLVALQRSANLTEETAPAFLAFMHWLLKHVAEANTWGYRIIPYVG